MDYSAAPRSAGESIALVTGAVEGFVRGKPETVALVVTAMLARGHVLLQDVPGVGKTSLARAIAAAVGSDWHRIQFTPDLLPGDVTGVSVYEPGSSTFRFHPGPVFTHVLLADEINRASPRTQAALLEAMEERQVTVDGEAHPLPDPFLVLATQNPVEMAGTYPLPEAQIDRFLVRVSLGYPDRDSEVEIIDAHHRGVRVSDVPQVLDVATLQEVIAQVEQVHVAPSVQRYIVDITAATRDDPRIALGASPRGAIGLLRVSRAWAARDGRAHVVPGDAQHLAVPVLAHRLVLTAEAEGDGATQESVVRDIVERVPAPQPEGVG